MSQQQRTELIREVKELLKMQHDSGNMMFDAEMIKSLNAVLRKCLKQSSR